MIRTSVYLDNECYQYLKLQNRRLGKTISELVREMIHVKMNKDVKKISETAAFFQAVHHLEITEAIGQQAGEFMNKYQKSHNVTLADSLIAAASLQHRFN